MDGVDFSLGPILPDELGLQGGAGVERKKGGGRVLRTSISTSLASRNPRSFFMITRAAVDFSSRASSQRGDSSRKGEHSSCATVSTAVTLNSTRQPLQSRKRGRVGRG